MRSWGLGWPVPDPKQEPPLRGTSGKDASDCATNRQCLTYTLIYDEANSSLLMTITSKSSLDMMGPLCIGAKLTAWVIRENALWPFKWSSCKRSLLKIEQHEELSASVRFVAVLPSLLSGELLGFHDRSLHWFFKKIKRIKHGVGQHLLGCFTHSTSTWFRGVNWDWPIHWRCNPNRMGEGIHLIHTF